MKTFNIFLCLAVILCTQEVMPQKIWPSIELIMQSDCDQGYEIEFKLESVSPTWDYDMNTEVFSITNNATILNSNITIEGTDLSNNNGWDMVTSKTSSHPDCGIGIYRLTTDLYDTYIYIDFRECQFALGSQGAIDTWFRYLYDEHAFYWNDLYRIDQWNKINTGQLIKIWQIKNTIPTTNCIGSTFWTNSLAVLPFNNNEFSEKENLRPVWGHNPDQTNITQYYLYRKIDNNEFTKISELNNQTFDFIDNSIKYSIYSNNSTVSYMVKSYNGAESSPTNVAFPDYYIEFDWNNGLIFTNNGSHPKLVWVPHPTFNAAKYRVYRAVSNNPVNPASLSYNLIHQTENSSTFEFTDYAVTILPGYQYAYYYVVGWNGSNESVKTNYVGTPAEFQKPLIPELNQEIPKDFALYQNYPNPFNPRTKISYSIKDEGFVTLKVYDVLGNEVATLVDELRNAGSYEVDFDASQLSSGVYFYKLQAGDFVQAKKMLLMK